MCVVCTRAHGRVSTREVIGARRYGVTVSGPAIVEWCLSRSVGRVRLPGGDEALAGALGEAGVNVVEPHGSADAVLWLRDAASTTPRPALVEGVKSGGWILGEGSLVVDGREPVPVEVEHNRVSLVASDRGETTRVEFVDGAVSTRSINVWLLDQLDAHVKQRGCRLEGRMVDWYGGSVVEASPCHLSWFRNVGAEPG